MDVDVPVILVGFPNGTARELDQRLEPEEIDHRMTDLNQPLPPNPRLDVFAHIPLQGEDFENPIVPTAHYNVQPAPATVVSGIAERVDRWAIDGNAAAREDRSSEHEGRALERYLAKALPSAGIPIDPRTPSLVMINGDAFLDANDT